MIKFNLQKVLYYEPDESITANYENQTYEMIYEKEREDLVQEYVDALSKKPQNIIRKIINLLESEYILDYILIYNLNPRMRLFNNADNFANEITNYTYFYTVNFE